jgi:hypothetical protein
MAESIFTIRINTIANNRLHQLLGLRLRFCLRGKYSDVFTPIFQRNFVDLFWPVPAAATECKRANVSGNFKNTVKIRNAEIQHKRKNIQF